MAAALFKRRRAAECGRIVRSAGMQGADGWPVLAMAQEVVHKRGMDLSHHFARIATPHLLPAFDLILVMETRHLDWIGENVPSAHGRSWLLGHWRGLEILRPANGHHAEYERIADEIEQCLGDWLARLQPRNDPSVRDRPSVAAPGSAG